MSCSAFGFLPLLLHAYANVRNCCCATALDLHCGLAPWLHACTRRCGGKGLSPWLHHVSGASGVRCRWEGGTRALHCTYMTKAKGKRKEKVNRSRYPTLISSIFTLRHQSAITGGWWWNVAIFYQFLHLTNPPRCYLSLFLIETSLLLGKKTWTVSLNILHVGLVCLHDL